MPTPLIIDTDAGYDDLLAVLYLLGDPSFSIEAVTVVYGLTTDLLLAGNVLRHVLEQTGNERVPVYLGSTTPLPGGHTVPQSWANKVAHLGWPKPNAGPLGGAVAYLEQAIFECVTPQILALGPLTNLAAALGSQRHHDRLQIRMMGGAFGLDGRQAIGNMEDAEPSAPHSEFNVYIDPSAARQIFARVPNIFAVPLNACSMVPIDEQFISDFEAISSDSPRTVLAKAVFDRISAYNEESLKSGQYFAWDPLAVVESALRERVSMTVSVDDLGVTSWSGPGPVTVALAADPEEFRSAFFKGFS